MFEPRCFSRFRFVFGDLPFSKPVVPSMIVAGLNGLNVNTASDGLGIPENSWGRISRKFKSNRPTLKGPWKLYLKTMIRCHPLKENTPFQPSIFPRLKDFSSHNRRIEHQIVLSINCVRMVKIITKHLVFMMEEVMGFGTKHLPTSTFFCVLEPRYVCCQNFLNLA